MRKKKSNTLKFDMHIEFDMSRPEEFSNFCKMLMDGGYEHVVRGMGEILLQEAKRRNLPVVKELTQAMT